MYRVEYYIDGCISGQSVFETIDDASEYAAKLQKNNSDITTIKIFNGDKPYMTFNIENNNVKVLWGV